METDIIEDNINNEVINIIDQNWDFMNKKYNKIKKQYYHRSEIKRITGIEIIKEKIYDRLGYMPVFYFLNELFAIKDYKGGAYKYVDKGILLLYQLLYGCTLTEMGKIIAYTSFYDIYKQFYLDEANYLNKKVDKMLLIMFSNIKLRVLNGLLLNPNPFKHVTLLLDGHDSRIEYHNISIHKKDLYSFKFKKPGLRTQVVTDINNMVIGVSSGKFCKNNVDGDMFLKMKLEDIIEKEDCIAFDGGYYYYIDKFIEENSDFNRSNFIYPYRKTKNITLDNKRAEFNKMFGSYRSKIETIFANIGNKFNKFDNSKAVTKTTNIKIHNLQFKIAMLLQNIQLFSEKYNIHENEHIKLWLNADFDYKYTNESITDDEYEEIYYNENYSELIKAQKDILNLQLLENLKNKKFKSNNPVILVDSLMDE